MNMRSNITAERHVPAVIRRAVNLPPCRFEKWGEDAIRRFSEIDGKTCSKIMSGRGAWKYINNSQADAMGRQKSIRSEVLAVLKSERRWLYRREIDAVVQVGPSACVDALHALVIQGKIEKRMERCPKTGGRRGQWRIKEGVE